MYRYFAGEYGYTPDEVDRLPMYLASIMMGAISPDCGRVRMHPEDARRYLKRK